MQTVLGTAVLMSLIGFVEDGKIFYTSWWIEVRRMGIAATIL